MRLFEAILEANHRAVAGDSQAGLHPTDFPDALPVVALTCADARLNHLLPEVLGVREEDFIWLRNVGNIVFDPLSSMVRSLAMACAVKGGKEIAIIGHSDCRVRQLSVNQLIDSFRALGIHRSSLPDDLVAFLGLFASERQNVISGVAHVRHSPLISPKTPVHGLLVDTQTGRVEWLVNGYEQLGGAVSASPLVQKFEQVKDLVNDVANFSLREAKFPEVKIGDLMLDPQRWLSELQVPKQETDEAAQMPGSPAAPAQSAAQVPAPPTIPVPPAIRLVRNILRPKQ